MSTEHGAQKSKITAIILIGRFVYSVNWFVLPTALPQIIKEEGMPIWFLGLVPFVFFLATGVFQIPSGLFSNRFGPVKTYVLGLATLSSGNLLLSLNASLSWIITTRMIAGLGSALFFASAGGILLELHTNRPGTIMGLYNFAFALGGGSGLLWGYLYQIFGWRIGIAVAGSIGIFIAFLNLVLVKNLDITGKYSMSDSISLVRDKDVVLTAVSFVGVWGVYLAIGQLLPAYEQTVLQKSIAESGLESSPLLFSSILGGLASFAYDRFRDKKLLLILSGLLSVIPSIFLSVSNGAFILPSVTILGFFNEMTLSMVYAFIQRKVTGTAAAGLAFINTIQILIGMWYSPFLSLISSAISWEVGWILLCVIGILPIFLMIKVKI